MVMTRRAPESSDGSSGDAPGAEPAGRRRTGLVARVLLLLFVAAAVWYGLARIDWPGLWRAIAGANALWIVLGVLSALASHLLRAHRWRLLIPDGRAISLRHAFSATIVGYMFNNIIPRSGELVRPWLIARRESRPLSTIIASVVVERIIDGLSLALIVVALAIVGRELIERLLPEYTAGGLVAAIVIPVLALVAAIIVAVRTSLGDRFVDLLARRLPERITTRIRSILADFRAGVQFESVGDGIAIAVYSVIIWLGYYLGIYLGFLAFGFDALHGLGPQAALVTLGITSIGLTIAPTPGGFLVYHSFCIAVLAGVYGLPNEEAAAYAVVTHGAPYIVVTALGAAFALFENISIGSVLRGERDLPR
jgi:glycosyltransferase 2 family protein